MLEVLDYSIQVPTVRLTSMNVPVPHVRMVVHVMTWCSATDVYVQGVTQGDIVELKLMSVLQTPAKAVQTVWKG